MPNVLDSTQIISGIAVLLSFFVGYKYGQSIYSVKDNDEDYSDIEEEGAAHLSKDGATGLKPKVKVFDLSRIGGAIRKSSRRMVSIINI